MPIEDDSLVSQYIRSIENPDSVGYRNGRWYAPDNSIYDKNNRGFGMDVNYNTATVDLTKDRPGKYLTEEEERALRLQHIRESEKVLDKWTPQILQKMPSEEKRAMAVGMIYRGDGVKSIVHNPTINKAYLYGSNEDMQKAVSDYYKFKKVSERAQRHNNFLNPQKKNTSIPNSIRRPTPYSLPKFDGIKFTPTKKYGEGGSLGNGWDSLSYKDKAEMIRVAVENGITTLPEIREAYNKYAEGGDTDNEFAKGGYAPSKKLQQDIATWEGSEMKRNRPFGEMTQQFNNVVPKELQDRLSTNQLDALYSYGYNVGMGNLKERVLPTLSAYTKGKATREDVQRSMWASKDNTLRGLTRRRNWERELFGGNYRTEFTGKGKVEKPKVQLGIQVDPVQYEIPDAFFNGFNRQINEVQMPQMKDPATLYKPVVVDDTLFAKDMPVNVEPVYDPMEEKRQGLRNFMTVMGMQDGGLFSGLFNKGDGRLGLMGVVEGIYG